MSKWGPVFEIRKGATEHYVVEIAPNGEPVSTSEGYTRKASAHRAAVKRAHALPRAGWRYEGDVTWRNVPLDR